MLTACVPGGVVQKRDDDEDEEEVVAAASPSNSSASPDLRVVDLNLASDTDNAACCNQRMQRQQSTEQVRGLNLIPPICSEPQQPWLDLIFRPGLNDHWQLCSGVLGFCLCLNGFVG